ncbi:hypothetical protein DBZ36_20435 [Alginatibacterium sediminis]|uniref:Porin n=1 Tax=Alginatibacterium sediminis TaxID=2164068 RepID=A0A420E5X9_9ALTE|nr:hypothetical protein [Alginatibacterium sediminis]RKF12745.1 hypothetical protein DBZ36_20435 [Alginatibacterium sediminis]
MNALTLIPFALFSGAVLAEQKTEDLKDMSDPMAIYTQVGMGVTDKGLNFKAGKTYETGQDNRGGMNLVEIKGVAGDTLGWRDQNEQVDGKPIYGGVDDSVDSIRFRNFEVNLANGRGTQLDINVAFGRTSYVQTVENAMQGDPTIEKTTAADISYSFMQAFPKWGKFQFFPLAGVGVNIENSASNGFEFPGMFGLVGMYSKLAITDDIWLMYNPMWVTTLVGSDIYKDYQFGGDSNLLAHEVSLSYKISPRTSVRYFGNWNDKVDYAHGDHRIEFNYQF